MKKREARAVAKPRIYFGVILGIYTAFFLGTYFSRFLQGARLDTLKDAYHHFDFVELRLKTRERGLSRYWRVRPPRARVLRYGQVVTTVAGLREIELVWDPQRSAWTSRWPCPWNAPAGDYALELVPDEKIKIRRLSQGTFRILNRAPKKLPERFAVLTWESVRPLESLRLKAPDGTVKDWRGLLDWAEYIGADAFWMLGGQTPGLKAQEIWVSHNLPLIPKVARECRSRGLKFGVWAMCYLTMSSERRVPGYEHALDVEEGRVKTTRAISIRDPKRPKDIADFLKQFSRIPEVDFLGLDYIRNALGGYELVDDFYSEMPGVRPPPFWQTLTAQEKMTWFIRKKASRQDKDLVDAWQWWRAHRVSKIIQSIKKELGEEKSLWAFTLTWERGWHHGQDVIMFRDAGIDVDALMLYEATAPQFEWLVDDWKSYVRKSQVQLLLGDVVDWPLHQNSPRGPGEFTYRMKRAIHGIHADDLPSGIFIHDLERALKGRLGPYTTQDWMQEARNVVRYFKDRSLSPMNTSPLSAKE